MATCLNLLGTGSLVYKFLSTPRRERKFQFKFMMVMIIPQFLAALVQLVSLIVYYAGGQVGFAPESQSALCVLQGFLKNVFSQITFQTSCVISYLLYQVIVKTQPVEKYSSKRIRHYLKYLLAVPVLVALIPVSTNNY